MLYFDDLQWADDLSLEILTELGRRTREQPVLLIGAYRTEELAPGSILREWRARLLTQRMAEEARLAPLTRDETGLMTTLILATGLPAPREVVAAVYERTDGIPLHIEELLGVIGDEARSNSRAIREAVVPDTIEDAIVARLARRSTEAQAVARAGAVIGRCFVPDVLAGIMDLKPESLDAPLRELVEHDFLDPPGPRELYDFRHQLLRDVLYRTIPVRELGRLHARAAEFCAQLEGASEIHASVHFERAGLRTQAFRAALAGAQEAARLSSHREAFELYRRAVANLPSEVDAGQRAELFEAYSEEAAAIEEEQIAEDAARNAREDYLATGRPLDAARVMATLAALARRQAKPIPERIEPLRVGLAELAALPPTREREQVRSLMLVAQSVMQLDALRTEDARASALEARAVAGAAGDAGTVIDASYRLASVEVVTGRVDEGLAAIAAAALEARDAGYEDVSVTAYRDAALMGLRVMDYVRTEDWLDEGLRYADAVEQSHCGHVMGATRAVVAWARGRWSEAVHRAEQAIADAGGGPRAAILARCALGYVALGRGNTEAARAAFAEALELGRPSGALDLTLPALWGLAEASLAAGDHVWAATQCAEALDLGHEAGELALMVPFVVTGTRANLAAVKPGEAARWLAAVGRYLAAIPSVARPALDHSMGLIRLAGGSTTAAREALEAAIRGWDGRERIWEASWARLDLAGCLMRANRFAAAASILSDVQVTAARLQSRPLAARADELGRVARARGALDEPWHPLTAREFEVARLIAAGMTNAEIADQLSIAPKTASAHVEHILAKLGMTRRAEIATWTANVSRPDASDSGLVAAAHR